MSNIPCDVRFCDACGRGLMGAETCGCNKKYCQECDKSWQEYEGKKEWNMDDDNCPECEKKNEQQEEV